MLQARSGSRLLVLLLLAMWVAPGEQWTQLLAQLLVQTKHGGRGGALVGVPEVWPIIRPRVLLLLLLLGHILVVLLLLVHRVHLFLRLWLLVELHRRLVLLSAEWRH